MPNLADMPTAVIRSQKALGVRGLMGLSGIHVPAASLCQDALQIPGWGYPYFARPCPTRPRHGFVESRVVKNFEEAAQTFKEALAADPDAEMLLMRPLAAACSAILTPGFAAIGPDHDGATSGKEGTEVFQLADLKVKGFRPEDWRIHDPEVPYFEVVYEKKAAYAGEEIRACFVQARSGPRPATGTGDYIPQDVTITTVIEARPDTDLLAYETAVQEAKPGAAIWHPGGNRVSHFSAHAMLRGLPIFFGPDKPAIGSFHKRKEEAATPHDAAAFRKGIEAGMRVRMGRHNHQRDVNILLLAVHHATTAVSRMGSFSLGYGAALMVRYGAAASAGEARHAKRSPDSHKTRDEIYEGAFTDTIKGILKGRAAFDAFVLKPWQSGFGGRAWADCAEKAINLDTALRLAYRKPTETRIKEVIAAFHNAVNAAHNNGWWLNKFVEESTFDSHAQARAAAVAYALGELYRAFRAVQAEGAPADSVIEHWRTMRAPRLGKVRARAAAKGLATGNASAKAAKVPQPAPIGYPYTLKAGEKALTVSVGEWGAETVTLHFQYGKMIPEGHTPAPQQAPFYASWNQAISDPSHAALKKFFDELVAVPSLSGSGKYYFMLWHGTGNVDVWGIYTPPGVSVFGLAAQVSNADAKALSAAAKLVNLVGPDSEGGK